MGLRENSAIASDALTEREQLGGPTVYSGDPLASDSSPLSQASKFISSEYAVVRCLPQLSFSHTPVESTASKSGL